MVRHRPINATAVTPPNSQNMVRHSPTDRNAAPAKGPASGANSATLAISAIIFTLSDSSKASWMAA